MNYWDGKCFMCLFWSTLIIILGLSVKPIYNSIKNENNKNKKTDTLRNQTPSQNGMPSMLSNQNQKILSRHSYSNYSQVQGNIQRQN